MFRAGGLVEGVFQQEVGCQLLVLVTRQVRLDARVAVEAQTLQCRGVVLMPVSNDAHLKRTCPVHQLMKLTTLMAPKVSC